MGKAIDKKIEDERFRLVVEASPNAIVMVGRDGKIVLVNSQTEKLFGYPRQELLGRPVEMLVPERFRGAHPGHRRGFFAAPQVRAMGAGRDLFGLRKDGREVPVEIGLNPTAGPEGSFVLASIIDITERKHAEELMRRSEHHLRTIIDTVPGLISYIDKDERYVFTNERYTEWFGRSSEQLKGALVRDLLDEDRYKIIGPIIKGALSGRIGSLDARVRYKDRERWVHIDLVPDQDESGVHGCFYFAVDITDSRRREEDLEGAVKARTEALQKSVADLEAFSYTVSHDLRAPLRAVQGYAHFLRKRGEHCLDSDCLELLKRISDSTIRMDRLIQDLLVFGRLSREDYRMYAVDLDSIVDHILEHYPGFERATVTVKKPLGMVVGQDSLLTQALSNLLVNAAKFASKDREPRIEVRTEAAAPGIARVTVEDNGIGIPDEFKAKLFQPFQRLHAGGEFDGTGIGLAIVKKAVERMGGTLGFESQIGRGSRFWIELPREA